MGSQRVAKLHSETENGGRSQHGAFRLVHLRAAHPPTPIASCLSGYARLAQEVRVPGSQRILPRRSKVASPPEIRGHALEGLLRKRERLHCVVYHGKARHEFDRRKERFRNTAFFTVVCHEGDPKHPRKCNTRRILVAQLRRTFNERVLKSGRVKGPNLQVANVAKLLGRGRSLGAHPVGIGSRVEEECFAVGAIANQELEIAGSNDLEFEPRCEQVKRATRIYDEHAGHPASCRSQIARGEVDRKLRTIVEQQLLVLLEDLARRPDVRVEVVRKLTFAQEFLVVCPDREIDIARG